MEQGVGVVKEFAREGEALLRGRDTLVVLNQSLEITNGIGGENPKKYSRVGEGLDEDLEGFSGQKEMALVETPLDPRVVVLFVIRVGIRERFVIRLIG